MCFGSALICPHEEFLIPHPPRSKFNPHPPRTHTQSSACSRTRPANVGTRNPRGLTRPAQDSNRYVKRKFLFCLNVCRSCCVTKPQFCHNACRCWKQNDLICNLCTKSKAICDLLYFYVRKASKVFFGMKLCTMLRNATVNLIAICKECC